MKITKTELTELIKDEIDNFKIDEFKIKKTNRIMKNLSKPSFPINAEKEEDLEEKLKMSKGSGRGTSWMNYDDDTYRMQVTKDSNQYHISVFKKFMGPSSKRLLDLRGISKTDAAKLVKLAKSTGLEKTAKYGKSKYKKYVSEGKLTEDFKNNEWEVYVADENRREKIVKVAKSKRAAVILYNKLIKTDKYHEVGMRVIKEGKLTEAKETVIDVAKRIVKNKQYEKYKGMMLDGFTANAIMKVYDAVNEKMKAKLEKLPLPKLVSIVWKVIK